MHFIGFEDADFDVFDVPGLEARMEVLKAQLRPKLEQLGEDFSEVLSTLTGQTMFKHVAKHARRTVNPPKDTWVAFCSDKRGYKKHPHFQIGLWSAHAFATFGLIYESPERMRFADMLEAHQDAVLQAVPQDFVWFPDHTNPQGITAAETDEAHFAELVRKLRGRQGELLVGIQIPRAEAISLGARGFYDKVKRCFETLMPVVRLAMEEHVEV